ncbi:50S ribosomal protein L21 [Acidithiobacillus ferrianus]|uniref:Large ribosomal subunit protein bL21 n=2 Tax=Acidithiobacillus ferrianus TaxID=2678518 RepID=A0A845U0W4_9PROT|nr:50S ribosomal protein L21 [Acidithiobacillus ferrianus]MDA8152469.1 50S ribosomal protein L21 [Acidithiobacillus sp.]NDU41202.1 50S ribosomal protein L21 [Acidithiobacillus ferrianus]
MYAVIENGGKQYRVAVGDKLRLEKMEAAPGAELAFDRVLMLGSGDTVQVGQPLVAGASVKVTVLSQGRAKKVHIFKMRRRKHYRKQQGHRQYFTEVRITGIEA